VVHLIGPKASSGSNAKAGIGAANGLNAVPLTPMALASQLLGHLTASTSVTVGSPVYVAGEPAYQLLVAPKGAASSTIRHIEVAIGTSGPLTGVPLQVAIYAKGQASPALQLGFTGQLQPGPPAQGELTFTPPPGATVITRTLGSGSSGVAGTSPFAPLAKLFGPVNPVGPAGSAKVTKSGKGWATVVSAPSGQLLGSVAAGPLSALTRVVTVHGQQGRLFSTELLNVLIMQSGRVYSGFVSPSALEAAASANT